MNDRDFRKKEERRGHFCDNHCDSATRGQFSLLYQSSTLVFYINLPTNNLDFYCLFKKEVTKVPNKKQNNNLTIVILID